MKRLIFLIVLIFTAFGYKNQEQKKAWLICQLTSDKTNYKIGEVPKLEVQIINESNREIYLIGSLDGSDIKRRMPYCYFVIDKPKPDTVLQARCGNTNPLRIEDFKIVQPKEKFNPYQRIDDYDFFSDYVVMQRETFRNRGIYKIQFRYSTNTNKLADFLGISGPWIRSSDSMKIKNCFSKVPRIDIVSNSLKIEFEE